MLETEWRRLMEVTERWHPFPLEPPLLAQFCWPSLQCLLLTSKAAAAKEIQRSRKQEGAELQKNPALERWCILKIQVFQKRQKKNSQKGQVPCLSGSPSQQKRVETQEAYILKPTAVSYLIPPPCALCDLGHLWGKQKRWAAGNSLGRSLPPHGSILDGSFWREEISRTAVSIEFLQKKKRLQGGGPT